ncbi:MAG: hypothetical protein HQL35_15450 [Alphaproteobacteria bacterium]|nr:hypothetical protein [Alphaproteobacteria bacterium]
MTAIAFRHDPTPRPSRVVVRVGAAAQVLRFAPAHPFSAPPADGAALMADCGHPQWPFWRLVLVTLALTQAVLLAAPDGPNALRAFRARPRPPVTRAARDRKD